MEMIIENASHFNENHLEFDNPRLFEQHFWETLTRGKKYDSFKTLVNALTHLINMEYRKFFWMLMKLNFFCFKIVYDVLKTSNDNLDFTVKLALTTTLNHAYQVSNITGVSIDETIKRLRILRNIQIVDKKTKEKKMTRQVRYPLVASEVCPFTNYVKEFEVKPKLKFNYSIMVIEKPTIMVIEKYECDKHDSCVVYKDMDGIIKHLDECEFWTDDQYWIRKYPKETEVIE